MTFLKPTGRILLYSRRAYWERQTGPRSDATSPIPTSTEAPPSVFILRRPAPAQRLQIAFPVGPANPCETYTA